MDQQSPQTEQPTTPAAPATPQHETMKLTPGDHGVHHFSKVVLVGMGALLTIVTALGAGLYLGANKPEKNRISTLAPTALPTGDPTVDWRTVTRTNWTFKVPADWHYLECDESVIFVGQEIEKDETIDCGFDALPGIISIRRDTHLANPPTSLEDGVTKPSNVEISDENGTRTVTTPIISNKSYTTIDGERAITWIQEHTVGQGIGKYKEAYIHTKNTWITLDDLSQQEVFNQFLSTVHFTSGSAQTDTSPTLKPNKSYTDKDYGYSISYPDTWIFRRTYGKDIPKGAPTDVISGIDLARPSNYTLTFVLNVFEKKNETSLVGWWNKYSQDRYKGEMQKTNDTFNGVPAIKTISTSVVESEQRVTEHIYFFWEDSVYFIARQYEQGDSLIKELNDITNSLKLP